MRSHRGGDEEIRGVYGEIRGVNEKVMRNSGMATYY